MQNASALAELCGQEADAWAHADHAEASRLRRQQQTIIEQDLVDTLPAWVREVDEQARTR